MRRLNLVRMQTELLQERLQRIAYIIRNKAQAVNYPDKEPREIKNAKFKRDEYRAKAAAFDKLVQEWYSSFERLKRVQQDAAETVVNRLQEEILFAATPQEALEKLKAAEEKYLPKLKEEK